MYLSGDDAVVHMFLLPKGTESEWKWVAPAANHVMPGYVDLLMDLNKSIRIENFLVLMLLIILIET